MSRLASLFGILTLAMFNSLQVNAQNIPKSQCRESSWNGRVTCGYNCIESSWNGQVACADWPGGVCKESSWNGQITCGPSAPPNWTYLYGNGNNVNSTVPFISWSIYRYSVTSTECQQKSHYSMQKLGLVSLNYGEVNRMKYVGGNDRNNTARIGCLDNNTLLIFVAGSNQEYVNNLRKNLIENLGLRLQAL